MTRRFRVEVHIGEKRYGAGTGHTKKAAEQEAAYRHFCFETETVIMRKSQRNNEV